MRDDRRRQQKSWQEVLDQGGKLRVMLKSALTPPAAPVTSGSPAVTKFKPTSVDVYVLLTDFDTEPDADGPFRNQIVSDEVLTVAVYDHTLPGQTLPTGKTGAYGHVELIDGILELTWIAC